MLHSYASQGGPPIYIRDLFEEKDKIYNLCSTVSLKQPTCNTVTYGLNSFPYKGVKIWNDLPNKIKNSITLTKLKNGKDQRVFAICAQDCYRMQLI